MTNVVMVEGECWNSVKILS